MATLAKTIEARGFFRNSTRDCFLFFAVGKPDLRGNCDFLSFLQDFEVWQNCSQTNLLKRQKFLFTKTLSQKAQWSR